MDESELDESTIREIVRDELRSGEAKSTRRDLLKGAGIAGVLGIAGGAASGSAAAATGGDAPLSVGSVTASTYQIAGNRYGGPDGAQSELVSELGSSDAGAKYLADDTGALYHWSGSAWELMDAKVGSLNTEYAGITDGVGLGSKPLSQDYAGIHHERLQPWGVVDDTDGETTNVAVYCPIDDDHKVAVFRTGDGDLGNDGKLVMRESHDGGVTWSDKTELYDSSFDVTNPGGGVAPNGNIVIALTEMDRTTNPTSMHDQGIIVSTDKGDSWSGLKTIDGRGWANPGNFVNGYGKMVETDAGNLLVPFLGFDLSDSTVGEIWVVESTDGGSTWSYKSTVASGNDYREADIVKLSNGNLIVVASDRNNSTLMQFSSTDGGGTWSTDGAFSVGSNTGNPVAPHLWESEGEIRITAMNRQGGAGVATGGSYGFFNLNEGVYAHADNSSITGSPSNWEDWPYLQASGRNNSAKHYGTAVQDTDGTGAFLTTVWSASELVLMSEDFIRDLCASSQVLKTNIDDFGTNYSREPNVRVGERDFVSYGEDETLLTSGTASSLTTVSSDAIPYGAREIRVVVRVDDDGTGGFTKVSFALPTEQETVATVGGPADASLAQFDTISLPVSGGEFQYQINGNVEKIDIWLKGWR